MGDASSNTCAHLKVTLVLTLRLRAIDTANSIEKFFVSVARNDY
jgi:hypothetical protein